MKWNADLLGITSMRTIPIYHASEFSSAAGKGEEKAHRLAEACVVQLCSESTFGSNA